jgi:hypothetical protein
LKYQLQELHHPISIRQHACPWHRHGKDRSSECMTHLGGETLTDPAEVDWLAIKVTWPSEAVNRFYGSSSSSENNGPGRKVSFLFSFGRSYPNLFGHGLHQEEQEQNMDSGIQERLTSLTRTTEKLVGSVETASQETV